MAFQVDDILIGIGVFIGVYVILSSTITNTFIGGDAGVKIIIGKIIRKVVNNLNIS